ncbi:MAG: hypothetical protein ABIW38_14410 [Ferruginibacter sp.]
MYFVIKNNLVKFIIKISVATFILYAIIDYFLYDRTKFNNHASIVSSFSLIIILIYFFYEKMQTVFLYPLYQSISFWICVGFFLYFTGTFFFFLFTSNYSNNKALLNQMLVIYTLVTITKNVILSLALFANEPQERKEEELFIPKDLQLDEFTLNPTKP